MGVFVNTWSVEGFVSEGMQPAELGWGTHETWMPENARTHETGPQAAIYLLQPGANTRVRTWCPTPGPQYGFLVTHNESISIADYFTVRENGQGGLSADLPLRLSSRNDAVLSLHEMFGNAGESRRSSTSSTRTRSSTASTSSASCSTATARTPIGTARSSPSRRRAARALPERHRPPGDLGRARRHGLGAGEPERRHRRGRRDGFPPLPRSADALSRPGRRLLYRLDAARPTVPGFFPEDIDRPIPGSSGTCWCDNDRRRAWVFDAAPRRLRRPVCPISRNSTPTSCAAAWASSMRNPCSTCAAHPASRRPPRSRTCWSAAASRRRNPSPSVSSPPPEGGGETLFQPIGKALLEAKKRGWIDRLQTLPAQDGLGFYVVLAGKPDRGDIHS